LLFHPHGNPAVAVMVDNIEMAQETLQRIGFRMISERELQDAD
jgi:hypothetical protein